MVWGVLHELGGEGMRRGQTALEFLMTFGWVILAGLVVSVLLVTWLYDLGEEPEFKITREECIDRPTFNLMTTNCSSAQYDGKWIIVCEKEPFYYKEICERVEILDEQIIILNSGESISTEELQDWSKAVEWLNIKCECKNYCRKRAGQTQCILDVEASIRGNYKCQEWQCADYTVEVVR